MGKRQRGMGAFDELLGFSPRTQTQGAPANGFVEATVNVASGVTLIVRYDLDNSRPYCEYIKDYADNYLFTVYPRGYPDRWINGELWIPKQSDLRVSHEIVAVFLWQAWLRARAGGYASSLVYLLTSINAGGDEQPWASLHDRASRYYRQIIGIWAWSDVELSRVVADDATSFVVGYFRSIDASQRAIYKEIAKGIADGNYGTKRKRGSRG